MKTSFRPILLASSLFFLSQGANAALDPAQTATLKTVCNADTTCAGYITAADDQAIANWFNANDPLNCIVWRNDVTFSEVTKVMVWTEIDALAVGKARIWEWMRVQLPMLDARDSNIRQGLSDAFSTATNTRTALVSLAKRTANRAEKALMQAGGACTTASPSIMTFVGKVTVQEASLIRS